jgi:UDP-N-acetyl-D-galactosamine dehydrogenase
MKKSDPRIAVIGLGYVGLPLAVAFAKHFEVKGFDVDKARVKALAEGIDKTGECNALEIGSAKLLEFTHTQSDIADCDVYIVTVPTPVNRTNEPDLSPLTNATSVIAGFLKKGDVVVYESTVYPGCTEEVCVPILEKGSGLTYNQDFFCGYSPERINPGDKKRGLTDIVKITSGSNPHSAEFIDSLYRKIISAGTHKTASIRVAEAAKVIENTQRDVNIALINELSMIFTRLGIETGEVLSAAKTKWNFLPFEPGLVGGHCIGVDPYYLTHKARSVGYHPEIILAGRRLNDGMGAYVASRLVKKLGQQGGVVGKPKVLVLGLTFKENCPDLRNTKVVDIVRELVDFGCKVDVHDPYASTEHALEEYGIEILSSIVPGFYDAVIIAVAHDQYRNLGAKNIRQYCKPEGVLFDVKSIFQSFESDLRL